MADLVFIPRVAVDDIPGATIAFLFSGDAFRRKTILRRTRKHRDVGFFQRPAFAFPIWRPDVIAFLVSRFHNTFLLPGCTT
jgi:hypothetical protein